MTTVVRTAIAWGATQLQFWDERRCVGSGNQRAIVSKLIFSSDALSPSLAPGTRARAWAESLMAGGYNGEAVVPDSESPFSGHVELMAPGGTMLAKSRANSLVLTRRPHHIARDMDDRITLFFNQGKVEMRTVQMGREMVLGAGEGVLVSQDTPQILDGSRSGDVIALILPREPFDAWRTTIHDLAGRRHDFSSPAYRLLRGYSRMLVDEVAAMSETEIDAVTRHVTELSRMWLGVSGGGAHAGESAQASRLLAIRTLIRRNFRRPELSVAMVARALGLSDRMVHHVLTASGSSFGRMVVDTRLAATYAQLIDPAYSGHAIYDLAMSCGFTDYSMFFRRFRQRYGETPQSVRPSNSN